MSHTQSVAIIGAGLSGLALAISLHQQGVNSTIYESRASPMNIGGAVTLSPNSLRILENLGLYASIKKTGYNFETLEFRRASGKVVDIYPFGSVPDNGYQANRIYRYEVIDIMLEALRAANIKVIYGKKFHQILSETDSDVTFEFTDGAKSTANLLVGADGIHSTVRKYTYPEAQYAAQFAHQAALGASIPASNIPASIRPKMPLTIMSANHGAFVLAPQRVDGSEYLIARQRRIPTDPTRADWDAIAADTQTTIDFLRADAEEFGPIVVAAVQDLDPTRLTIWPFYVVPKLDRGWASEKRRVVLVGDAAHAILPSSGQGINQAMEDVYMLALLMREVMEGVVGMDEALGFWQGFRQDRVEKITELCGRIDRRRLPKLQGVEEPVDNEEGWDLDWLYNIDIKRAVDGWVAERKVQNDG